MDEERSQVETAAILRNDEVNGVGATITGRRASHSVKMGRLEWVCDVKRVVEINVTVGVACEVIEDLLLQ